MIRFLLFFCFLSSVSYTDGHSDSNLEDYYNDRFCDDVGGRRGVRHYYNLPDGKRTYVVVDCETDTRVFEGGLDKRSSLDSVQQVLFFAYLSDKHPAIVLFDTDKREGIYEYRIGVVAKKLHIEFLTIGY